MVRSNNASNDRNHRVADVHRTDRRNSGNVSSELYRIENVSIDDKDPLFDAVKVSFKRGFAPDIAYEAGSEKKCGKRSPFEHANEVIEEFALEDDISTPEIKKSEGKRADCQMAEGGSSAIPKSFNVDEIKDQQLTPSLLRDVTTQREATYRILATKGFVSDRSDRLTLNGYKGEVQGTKALRFATAKATKIFPDALTPAALKEQRGQHRAIFNNKIEACWPCRPHLGICDSSEWKESEFRRLL